jgi:hypothetical protein
MRETNDAQRSAQPQSSGLMSIDAFCQWANLGRTTVYGQIKQGDLTARKCGRRTFVAMEEALRWRNALPTM